MRLRVGRRRFAECARRAGREAKMREDVALGEHAANPSALDLVYVPLRNTVLLD